MSSSRRDFLKAGVAATALPALCGADTGSKKAATDWVTLGKSNVKVTHLAMGTGTHSGAQQRHLGQPEFTRLVRYAYDSGIRFFETADAYHAMPEMLAVALKGIPRDSYRLMTKYDVHHSEDPMAAVHRLNAALGAEYVVNNHKTLRRKVYSIPTDIDNEIARLKLKALGIPIDTLTAEQEHYLSSWEMGT